jgi:hypothetical protein
MGITTSIHYNRNNWKISDGGLGEIVVHPHPPVDSNITPTPFRAFFRAEDNTNNMRVVGSLANPIPFFIKASTENDIYIKSISIVISDQNATLEKFGAISVLTNGVQLTWSTLKQGEIPLHDNLRRNFDFVRLSGGEPAFGSTANAFRADKISGNSEGYLPFLDMQRIFGMPWGIRLNKGTTDSVQFIIRDDITAIDQFNAIAYGIQVDTMTSKD